MASAMFPLFMDFNYREIEQNYDPIYETLVAGGVVWMDIDFMSECGEYDWPASTLYTGHNRFMVTQWTLCHDGLVIVCPWNQNGTNDVLCFPNGSYHEPSNPSE
jgi:hypothetical protein